jgi:hypothetical protein
MDSPAVVAGRTTSARRSACSSSCGCLQRHRRCPVAHRNESIVQRHTYAHTHTHTHAQHTRTKNVDMDTVRPRSESESGLKRWLANQGARGGGARVVLAGTVFATLAIEPFSDRLENVLQYHRPTDRKTDTLMSSTTPRQRYRCEPALGSSPPVYPAYHRYKR